MKVLFICTHNRCRSILSEAITNHISGSQWQAFSAGSQPVGQVHPLSIKFLAERGFSTEGLKSESWDDFETVKPDLVVTVCDSAANESCPVWFDDTLVLHWGLTDPSKLDGSEQELRAAFFEVMDVIAARAKRLAEVDSSLTGDALKQALIAINND